jgi:hypothetical protein
MPARFDDSIPYDGDKVLAIGPLHPDERIKEVCAWIFQPTEDRKRDVAATEMTTNKAEPVDFQQVDGERWLLVLQKLESTASFRRGRAFAVAVALVEDMSTAGEERVVWWGQPVDLFEDRGRLEAASRKDALKHPPLKDPAPFPPPGGRGGSVDRA